MSTFTFSGVGDQALSVGTKFLYVTIVTLPAMSSFGSAHPTNYYAVGLLRPGDASGYVPPIPILGGPQRIDLPAGISRVGYSIFGAGVVSVVEAAALPTIVFSSIDGTTVSGTAAITVSFENVEFPTANDWLTVQPTTEGLDTGNRYLGTGGFVYASSGSTSPGGTALSGGSWSTTLNSAPSGLYETRLYANDTLSLLARGPSFTVA